MKGQILRFFEQNKKLTVKVIAGVLLFAVAFTFYLMKDKSSDEGMLLSDMPGTEEQSDNRVTEAAVEGNTAVIVDVAGAVVKPSVVELPAGSRVFEAIDKAGGLSADADTRNTNQAEMLTDGQKIYIPTKLELQQEETAGSGTSAVSNSSSGAKKQSNSGITGKAGLVNINTADSAALQQLKGVGPSTAEKIINYRNENGKFKALEDLKNVSGIGDKTFEKLKDKITV